ncbi:hypothetical protein ACH4ZX_37745 [Streptomyces sp. NPDC020490]|uniref:hypothetical protein n=1 Tax=Streptomyces sp. NPDC020490 TaxID=3365078 RepID=UPI0037BA7DF7
MEELTMPLRDELAFKAIAAALGDADDVLRNAEQWKSVGRWKWWQSSQAVGLAAAGALIPGVWVVAAPASVVFTYRKMAHVAWAVGQDMGVPVEPVTDILLITGLWTGAVSEDDLTAARAAFGGIDLDALRSARAAQDAAVTRSLLEQAVPGFLGLLGVKLAAYVAGEVGASMAPVVGASIAGGATAALVEAFAAQARRYYTHKGG